LPIRLALVGLLFTACSQSELEKTVPASTETPSPTMVQTSTPSPSATMTIEPTTPPTPTQTATRQPPREVRVQQIPLTGSIASPDAQISGMAWYGDTLIILPQYPEKKPAVSAAPSLFALEKKDVIAYLEGLVPGPLTPTRITFNAGVIGSQIPGYEGYEAITFAGDRVYLTIEANDSGRMAGYLVEGTYFPDQNVIRIDPSSLTEVPVPVQIFNYAYESLITPEDKLLTIYEANGVQLNPDPVAFLTDISSASSTEVNFSNIEFRITDATGIDENGHFWVTNIFMPIEFWLYTDTDPIFEEFGKGPTHAENLNVERLLELQYNGDDVFLTAAEPIQLELIDQSIARNWEALVVLEDMGFLAMTDTYPDTILAFIPYPDK
jgi:hypothetical protein